MLHEDQVEDFFDDVALALAPIPQADAWKLEAISQAQGDLLALTGRGVGAEEWITFETAASLLSREFAPTPWVIRGLLTHRSVYAIAGEPKTTKTWCALDLGLSIATGTPAFGEFPAVIKPTAVVFVMAEDNAQAARNRLRALAKARGVDLVATGLGANVHVLSMARLDLGRPRDLARLVAAVRKIGAIGAVVLDPLVNLHHAEENSAKEMTAIMSALRLLRDVLECSVIFVHHAMKATEASKGRRPGQRMRGSSSIHGAVDGGLYLTDLDTDGQSRWTNNAHVELKSAKSAGSFKLTLTVQDDEHDEAVEAKWEHKPLNAAKTAADDELVLAALTRLEEEAPGNYHPIDAVREESGRAKKAVLAALHNLLSTRQAERGLGVRGGWRVVR